MSLTVLTAVTGAWEAPLVSGLERARAGVVVVRRCVDLTDLLAAAAAGQARAVLLSADLRRLDRSSLDRLEAARVAVVGLTDPDEAGAGPEAPATRRLRLLGVRHVLPADAAPHEVAETVARAVHELEEGTGSATAVGDPAAALASPTGPPLPGVAPGGPARRVGSVVAVWGPVGAPGRTTVAVTLAAELAAAGERVLLADADTYGASVAQVLGLLDEAPGLAAACRAASAGALDEVALARLAPEVAPRLRVLTGISRSARWPELSGGALEEVWRTARSVAAWTVVDAGAVLEADEEISFDTASPRRNAATLTTLEFADRVLAVGAAEPVGLQRLVRGLAELAEVVPGAAPRVVLTRVRASAAGPSPRQRVSEALERYAGVSDPVLVPDDRPACDAALLAGRSLTEAAPSSPARRALADLAAELAGPAPRVRGRGRRRSARMLG
jgi:MinD-like ATPase involved in chromosome partitioning or flagellar assembly